MMAYTKTAATMAAVEAEEQKRDIESKQHGKDRARGHSR